MFMMVRLSTYASGRWLLADDGGSEIEIENALVSWQPIFIPIVLTLIQAAFFLCIFECARRSPDLEWIYDRRRRVGNDARVPPPLQKYRGWLNGWLAFEWWRVRVSDDEYNKRAVEEHRRIQRVRQWKQQSTDKEHEEESDEFLKRAERQCYRESPFYDPSNDLEYDDDDDAVEHGDSPEFQPELEVDLDKLMEESESSVPGDQSEAEQPLAPPTSSRSSVSPARRVWRSIASPAAGILRHRSSSTNSTTPATVESNNSSPFSSRALQGVPGLALSGDLERSERHVRFQGLSDTLAGSNAYFRCDDATRLARLRSAKANFQTPWNDSAISAIFKFIKKKVLMVHRRGVTPPGVTETRRQAHDYIAHKVTRRPLSKEQQELLRCIGLDSFMTLRFLEFGFRVSIWPTLIALVILVPTYVTGNGTAQTNSFFRTTILALEDGTWRYGVVFVIVYLQFFKILRGLWVEWELFLPLRYDFLENGDFMDEKYKEQYQKTCLIEYVPKALRNDTGLFAFFDCVFPGQIQRAEVLLDTEKLRSLNKERLKHIVAYEDVFAKQVYHRAKYLRDLSVYENSGPLKRCCRVSFKPHEPPDPRVNVKHKIREEDGNIATTLPKQVLDIETYPALKFHHRMIQNLNKRIETEFFRLAQRKGKTITKLNESILSKWLGIKYLTGSGPGNLHSSTAFVEFATLAAKQEAIQCNITGTNDCMVVSPVPEVRDILWDNMNVSRRLIAVRRSWANLLFTGGLLLWSLLVSTIRGYDEISAWFHMNDPAFVVFIDTYVPALLVEGLVRLIPFFLRAVTIWIRFKSASEIDHYVLRWYFSYRLMTFIFVIVGGNIIYESDDLVQDPIGLVRRLSDSVPQNSDFFISYVVVAGGVQIFFRFSQVHNILLHWFSDKMFTREATSQRRLDRRRTSIKIFHNDEFIPLFLIVFMVGAVYIPLAPISGLFVAAFFFVANKIFKCMTLFTYGKDYEGGGFMFYTLSDILFCVLYITIVSSAGYFSLHGSKVLGGMYSVLLLITVVVHRDVLKTFIKPSKTLSLAKARAVDEASDTRTPHDRKIQEFIRARQALETFERKGSTDIDDREIELFQGLLATPVPAPTLFDGDPMELDAGAESGLQSDEMEFLEVEQRQRAAARMQRLYQEELGESCSEFADSELSGHRAGFFIYRQPSLNQATWEVAPLPYRGKSPPKRDSVPPWREHLFLIDEAS